MPFTVRQFEQEDNFCQHVSLDAFQQVIPPTQVEAVLATYGPVGTRVRRLTPRAIVWLIIAMHLFSRSSLAHVFQHLIRGLRFLWPDPLYQLPGDAALSYRRYQLGAKPLVALFHAICRPMATPQTPGAFLFGLRLMAIDGTTEDVADTPENARAFGRQKTPRGQSAFPQLKGVYLVECGTHAIVDAGFWPIHRSERTGGLRVLRSVAAGMLVMWDRGFHSFEMILATLARGAACLGRLPAHVHPQVVRRLPDGSCLAYLMPSDYHERQAGARILVRLVEYTITDPQLEGYGERHRLVTSLLDPATAPALQIACAYHERWEIELVIDEVDTHQRLVGRPLRSLLPVGVIQELYGLLLAHYALRFLMHQAALAANLDPDRLSFVHALEVIQDAISDFQLAAPRHFDQLYQRLLHDIASVHLPTRRFRSNPRVVKQKMSNFALKRPAHYRPYQRDGCFAQVVALI
jgi:Insertion element 4 transposase N-terminal/Transposase DDE domain